MPSRKRKPDKFAKMTKRALVEAYLADYTDEYEGVSVEQVYEAQRLTRAAIIKHLRWRLRRAKSERQEPCPQGHKPGDPKCDLLCFVSIIEPYDYEQFEFPEQQLGWWWRIPRGCWLKLLAAFARLKNRWTWRHR